MTHQDNKLSRRIGMRDYYAGEIEGQRCVVVLARLGKVAAAATTVTLIREFGVTEIIFTGLAGGIATHAKVGDVVIGDRLIQHDLDVRPFFKRHEVPLLGISEFLADVSLSSELKSAADLFFKYDMRQSIDIETLAAFAIAQPTVHVGMIASGDQFVGSAEEVKRLQSILPAAVVVEMEGAAVAQICHEYNVPCAVLRTVSDRADDSAHVDFGNFLSCIASHYSTGIVRRMLTGRSMRHTLSGHGATTCNL